MSRILITGATGFVGRAVIAALRRDGHTLSGTTRQPDLGQGPGGIPLYRIGELGPDLDWSAAVAGAEVVVHLAARVHMMKERASKASGIHLMAHLATNAEGTMRLAEAAAKAFSLIAKWAPSRPAPALTASIKIVVVARNGN